MALKIRLSRGGAKKRPFYRIVVADARSPRDGRFIERVGTYNPMVAKDSDDRVILKQERIKYWLSQGAKPSDRVARFLGQAEIVQLPDRSEQTKQHLPRTKTLERMKEKEAAAAAAESTAPAPDEAPAEEPPAEEPPAEEPPAEEPPAEENPAEEPPAEEAQAEKTQADEAQADNAPIEEVAEEGASAEPADKTE